MARCPGVTMLAESVRCSCRWLGTNKLDCRWVPIVEPARQDPAAQAEGNPVLAWWSRFLYQDIMTRARRAVVRDTVVQVVGR